MERAEYFFSCRGVWLELKWPGFQNGSASLLKDGV